MRFIYGFPVVSRLSLRLLLYLLLFLYIICNLTIGTSDLPTQLEVFVKYPARQFRSRNIFIKRWREGLRRLHLSEQDQWPLILKTAVKHHFLRKDSDTKQTLSDNLSPKFVRNHLTSSMDESVLPPMDESVVNELSQPNMPTFQEFHAKVLVENQNKRRLDLSDESVSAASGHSAKGSLFGATSNLSKLPQRGNEAVFNSASTDSDSATTTSFPSQPTSSTASTNIYDIIYPSNVMENGATGSGASKSGEQKLRVIRNIAATECGAKLLLASPSAKHAKAILVNNNDEYMNQPCASEKWFIIETCEPVQLATIQIANYELFSSRCKNFRVFVSDRYPAKQWEQIGTFQAQDVKGLQSFHIPNSGTGRLIKYVKFEILDHHGNEHFCPITMVRLFGLGSDEMDEPGLPSPSSTSISANDHVPPVGEWEGDNSTSMVNTTHAEASHSHHEAKETMTTPSASSQKPSSRQQTKKKKTKRGPQAVVDPPVNQSSVEQEDARSRADSRDCEYGESTEHRATPPPTKSSGLWQHATRFFMSVLQSALGAKSSSLHLESSNATLVNSIASNSHEEPTTEDFYSVIYVFSAFAPFANVTPSSAMETKSLGLWHLAQCLLSLHTSTPLRMLSVSHRAWTDCTAAAFLLNLTSTMGSVNALLFFQRLSVAYRNLTSAFYRWPAALTERAMGKPLPLPNFLYHRAPLTTTVSSPIKPFHDDSKASGPETVEEDLIENGSSALSNDFPSVPPVRPPSSKAPLSLSESVLKTKEEGREGEEAITQTPPPSSSVPPFLSNVDEGRVWAEETADGVLQTTPSEQLSSQERVAEAPMVVESEAVKAETEAEREVVLPAAMGGSWKETVYMRLNNKVLQLQSDVSVSMRYLEELSQSYKRQTERLSASFNLTTAWLKATAKGAEERDLLQQERIDALEAQLTKLLHILAEQRVVALTNSSSHSTPFMSSPVPRFRRPYSSPSTSGVDLQSILWSIFFQSPAASAYTLADCPTSGSKTDCTKSRSTCEFSVNYTADRSGKCGLGCTSNATTLSALRQTSSRGELSSRSHAMETHLSPQASLLLSGRRLKRQQGMGEEESRHWRAADVGRFFLIVLSRHLRCLLLSESFLLCLLHVCLAVLAQTFVYVVFLRSALRRCLPNPSPSALTPTCEICTGGTCFSVMTRTKGVAYGDEGPTCQPGLSRASTDEAVVVTPPLWEDSLTPTSASLALPTDADLPDACSKPTLDGSGLLRSGKFLKGTTMDKVGGGGGEKSKAKRDVDECTSTTSSTIVEENVASFGPQSSRWKRISRKKQKRKQRS